MRHDVEESSSDSAAGSPETLTALVRTALAGPDRDLLFERDAGGAWTPLGAHEVRRRVEAIALALRARGCETGDRVALMSPNRVDWIVANLGILFAGCVTVPIYATQALDQVAFIVSDSGARALFVDCAEVAARVAVAGVTIAPVVFDAEGGAPESLAAFIAEGEAERVARGGELDRIAAGIQSNDLAVLIYTSGTTGQPKGVMLTHGNIASTAVSAFGFVTEMIAPNSPVLAVLPFAHIYEHLNIFGYLLRGATVYVNRRIEALLEDLRSVRPVAVFAVPRIFERTYAGILAKSHAAGGLKARLVPWALRVGMRYKRAELDGERAGPALRLRFKLAHALVLSKLRGQLGCDRLAFFGSGSAALHVDIALVFAAADFLILEGYGLTECSPVVTVNDPKNARIGSVGKPIPGVSVRLGDDGELFVRGPNVMRGYYHRPEETAGVLHDGWFATGDIATVDREGFYRIVDRKKEIFKTSGGKFVSPARVEAAIARSPFVAQVVVFGSNKAHPAALISPNWPALRAELELPAGVADEDLARRDDVRLFLAAECTRETRELATFEQIRWAGVLPRDLTIDADELTPTLKVKRRVVEAKYGHLVTEFTERF